MGFNGILMGFVHCLGVAVFVVPKLTKLLKPIPDLAQCLAIVGDYRGEATEICWSWTVAAKTFYDLNGSKKVANSECLSQIHVSIGGWLIPRLVSGL